MKAGQRTKRRRAGAAIAGGLLAVWLLPVGAAPASPPIERGGDGDLSARLTELARPAVRSLPRRAQAQELSVADSGPGSLLRDGGRVVVEIRVDGAVGARAGQLRTAGIEVVDVSRRYRTVTAAVLPAQLNRLQNVEGVRAVREVLTPLVLGAGGGPGPVASAYEPCFGLETSEGDDQLRAADARAQFEIEGEGVKVGILSDSFDQDRFAPTGAPEDVLSGDLPGAGNPCGHPVPVQVLEEGEGGSDEGRAMAQIVHDLAPESPLAFATAFNGELGFAENIRALAAAGAEAIVDDVSYFEEPFFQEGPVGVAVSDVTADDDVAYFSSAGNDNLIDGEGNEIGSWEAPSFRDSGACPAAVAALGPVFNPSHCMDFNPGGGVDRTFGITVSPGATLILDLQWSEPWNGVATDLDALLIDPSGSEVVAGSAEENVFGSQRPVEIFVWENESGAAATVQLAINRFAGAASPRLKFALIQNGGGVTAIEYPKSAGGDVVGPTIFGHNGGEDAMSIGAIRFNTTAAPEPFSSRGPVTHYFGPANGITPAPPLGSPQVLAKPDVVATDGGANTFFGSCTGKAWRFFGTSAAAPHATAVAALARAADPSASAEEVKEAQREAAVGVGAFAPAAVGFGMVEAVGTLEALGLTPPSPAATPLEPPPPGPCLPPRKPAPPSGSPPASPPTGSSAALRDTTRPNTFIRKRPPHLILTEGNRARVVFRFASNEAGASFLCRIDGAPFRRCRSRFVRGFRLGRHVVRVVARDAAGNVDRSPAVSRFRVALRG